MASSLGSDVVADSETDHSEADLDLPPGMGTHDTMGIKPRHPKASIEFNPQSFGIAARETCHKPSTKQAFVSDNLLGSSLPVQTFTPPQPSYSSSSSNHSPLIRATKDISDEMIEDGAHVVFDWDNTLKLYDKETRRLSCRVSKEFLLHLKYDRRCRLYIISAIQPSALNLETLLIEVDRLGLRDVFTNDIGDEVDGMPPDQPVVRQEYACKGNIIICGYDKAETFLKLSAFSSARGDKVIFFDDEEWNITNFSALVPNSRCYLCQ